MNPLLQNALNLIAEEVFENARAHGFHNFDEDEGQFLTRTVANIAMYLHRKFTRIPLDEIGQCFKRPGGAGRDHGTVRWACESVAAMIATDPGLRVVIERLEMALSTKERV